MRNQPKTWAVAPAALLLGTLVLGFYGLERSLWLDEAWVANSVREPSWSGMFHYPNWLQTTPPLFLLAARGAVRAFGLSNVSLRIVPLAFALIAVVSMWSVARRALSPAMAVLAGTLLAFHPIAIEYSRSFKQYSGELAATTMVLLAAVCYFRNPARKQYLWLLGAVVIALPLAYPSAALLPGVILAVYWMDGRLRSAVLATVAAGVLAVL